MKSLLQMDQEYREEQRRIQDLARYPFKRDYKSIRVFGNKKRLIVEFKSPIMMNRRGITHSEDDSSSLITGRRYKISDEIFESAMKESSTISHIAFSVGNGVFMKVVNTHRYTPFFLKFWKEYDDQLGGPTVKGFNLMNPIWVRNPLESAEFLGRKFSSEIHDALVEWGARMGFVNGVPEIYNYQDSPSSFHFSVSSVTTADPTVSSSTYESYDVAPFKILKYVFYNGMYKMFGPGSPAQWDKVGLNFLTAVSYPSNRRINKCISVRDVVESVLGRAPKTIVKAFANNSQALLSADSSTNVSTSVYFSDYQTREITFISSSSLMLVKFLLEIEKVPIEYVVRMIPFMRINRNYNLRHDKNMFIQALSAFGYEKIVNMMEREEELLNSSTGLAQSEGGQMYQIEEAYRILRDTNTENPNPKQRRVFPNGIQPKKYYKTATEMHDDLSKQASRFKELGNSNFIPWDPRWKHLHGVRNGELRILLPRTTGTLIKWGKRQKHCIASYSDKMMNGDTDMAYTGGVHPVEVRRERTILAGVFKGSEILYCMRMEYKLSKWELVEFRGLQNKDPEVEHGKLVCEMLESNGISCDHWIKGNDAYYPNVMNLELANGGPFEQNEEV